MKYLGPKKERVLFFSIIYTCALYHCTTDVEFLSEFCMPYFRVNRSSGVVWHRGVASLAKVTKKSEKVIGASFTVDSSDL